MNRSVTALYRKYRPQTFAEVVGQEAVVRTLTNAIEQGKVRQAYLFAGPRGTGKTSLARILAKGINCAQGPTASPDNTCHACTSITSGTSLDVIEMDAASQRGIDDIRDIRDRVVLQPVEGRSKIYILDEAHQLTDAAWNALLKLIEEPPPHLVFVFCTTELQKVLPTVRSRCQTFVFTRPRLADLVRSLEPDADLLEDVFDVLQRHDAALSDQVGQRAAREVLHRQIEQTRPRFAEIVNANDLRRADLARRRRLAPEPRDHRGLVARERARDHLQRDELVEHLVVGEIDRPHATLAEQALHAIAPGEHLPGLERRADLRLDVVNARRERHRRVEPEWGRR